MIEVGQTVYLVKVECARRIYTGIITKIGRKYITVKLYSYQYQFDKDTLKQKNTGCGYGYDYVMFLTLEDYRTQVERKALVDIISGEFIRYRWQQKLSNGQLREIARILGVEEKAAELAKTMELTVS